MVVAGRTTLPGPTGDRAFSKSSRVRSNAPIGPLIATRISPNILPSLTGEDVASLDDESKNRELQP